MQDLTLNKVVSYQDPNVIFRQATRWQACLATVNAPLVLKHSLRIQTVFNTDGVQFVLHPQIIMNIFIL